MKISPPPELPSLAVTILCNEPPLPANSWFDYDATLIEAPALESTYQSTYGDASTSQEEFVPGQPGVYQPLVRYPTADYESSFSDGAPIQHWIWRGSVRRIGYPIQPPGKLMVGDKEAKIVGTPYFYARRVGYSFCLEIWEAVWNIALVTTERPNLAEDENDPTGSVIPDETVPG